MQMGFLHILSCAISLCQNSLDLPSADSYINLDIISSEIASVIDMGSLRITITWWIVAIGLR